MDLDNQGLSVHDNLAIQTNDLTELARSKEIFLRYVKNQKNYHRHQNSYKITKRKYRKFMKTIYSY